MRGNGEDSEDSKRKQGNGAKWRDGAENRAMKRRTVWCVDDTERSIPPHKIRIPAAFQHDIIAVPQDPISMTVPSISQRIPPQPWCKRGVFRCLWDQPSSEIKSRDRDFELDQVGVFGRLPVADVTNLDRVVPDA